MDVTIRFSKDEADTGPLGLRRPARRLLFTRDRAIAFDMGNYATSAHGAMEVFAACKRTHHAPDRDMHHLRHVRRAPARRAPDIEPIFLITTCEMEERDASRFLAQFDRASAFLEKQRGFLGFRLLENLDRAAPLRFVNVARWSSLWEFVAAFASDEFKACIRGGFAHRSRIMIARQAFPAMKQTLRAASGAALAGVETP